MKKAFTEDVALGNHEEHKDHEACLLGGRITITAILDKIKFLRVPRVLSG